jgi:SAM-dependent methyltransferase
VERTNMAQRAKAFLGGKSASGTSPEAIAPLSTEKPCHGHGWMLFTAACCAVFVLPIAGVRRAVRPLDFRRADECSRVIEWLAPAAGERILDVGCGDGFYDRRIAHIGALVDAIDARPERLALAMRWNPHPRVRLHHMSAEALEFPDNYFDKAVSICVLEHIADDEGALRHLHRVLRPGGRLVLSCDSLSNRGITDRLRASHAVRYAVQHFYTRESLAVQLERAGLELIRSEYVLTTPVSLAITRFTYVADDAGQLPGGWAIKYPAIALAGTAGLVMSRASEYLGAVKDRGLTLIAEAIKPG